ncbi:MAG: hydrogenase nickel incorporation protein HypB [Acidobacteriota bacterium]
MCESCGCGDHELVPLEIQEKILAGNETTARHNREHFAARGVLAINLMGSPGAGKTAVLEATAKRLAGSWRLAAMSGDLATDRDAQRLQAAGIPSLSITTGSACHLDARLVHDALHQLPWERSDVLFVENVGNLVCPAVYDLGQHANVVALSVTEGEDKPLKYPVMFRVADLVLITKADLLPHLLDVSLSKIRENLARVMPAAEAIVVSRGDSDPGITEWIEWLQRRRDVVRPPGVMFHPAVAHAHRHAVDLSRRPPVDLPPGHPRGIEP